MSEQSDFYVVIPSGVLDMGSQALAVYAALRHFADQRTNECWPSHKTLAERTGFSVSTVQRTLRLLRDEGWISWSSRNQENRGQTSNRYVVHGSNGDRNSQTPPVPDTDPPVPDTDPPGTTDRPPPVPDTDELITNELLTNELIHVSPESAGNDQRRAGLDDRQPVADPFDEFWSVFPRVRGGKKDARRAFTKALQVADAGTIVAGALRYRDDPNRLDAFTKGAAAWLNGERWDDPPLPHNEQAQREAERRRMQEWINAEATG